MCWCSFTSSIESNPDTRRLPHQAAEGLSFASSYASPDNSLVGSRSVLSNRAETASILPLTVSMTFQVAMWLLMFLSMHFTRDRSEIPNKD